MKPLLTAAPRSSPAPTRFGFLPFSREAVRAAVLGLLLAPIAGSSPARQAQPPAGQPATKVSEEIVVSADRLPVAASTVGSSITLITEEEIDRRASLTVAELLRTVPGVEITQTGGAGKTASVRIRGGDASQTLVLIDGVRVNSPTTGDFDFSNLTTDLIERIEVLRGPQATYGSEAVSGVISITTKKGTEGAHYDIQVEGGSEGLAHLRGSVNGRRGNFDYSFSASTFQIDGVSHNSERLGNTEEDPYDNQTVAGRFGYELGNEGRIELFVRSFEGDTELDGFLTDDPNAEQSTESLIATTRIQLPFSQRWTQRFEAGVHDSDLVGHDPDTFFNNYEIHARIEHLYLQSDFRLSDQDTLTFGLRREERHAENVGSFDEEVVIESAFLQNRWSWRDRFHMTAALRNDDHSVFGDETSWRATFAINATDATRIHASVGTSFRAPDFNELFFPFAGDPNLRPETSEGFDLGLEQSFANGRFSFDVTYFDLDFDDLIDFDFISFRFNNVSQAESSGIEASFSIIASEEVTLNLTHTYNDTENLLTGQPLARRPKSRSTLGVDFDPTTSIRGTLTIISVRDRIDSNGAEMDDYERVDLALRTRLATRFQPYFRIENLLDEDYEEVPGFTTLGRVIALGIRYQQ